MNRFVLAGVAVVALSGAAAAADLIVDPPAEVVTSSSYDWSGFYLGVIGGGGAGVIELAPGGGFFPPSIDNSGVLLGVTAGVNQQWDNLVLGLEADGAWTNISGSDELFGTGIIVTTTIPALATLRARAGVAVDRALLYATGGLAVGAVRLSDDYTGAADDETQMALGWTVGVGAEIAVTDDISLKAEYAYTDLGAVDFADVPFGRPATTATTTLHTVKVGANFHF